MPVTLRNYLPADGEDLLSVFRDAVSVTGLDAYPLQHVLAWLASADDDDVFIKALAQGITRIAVNEQGRSIGFAQLHPQGHVRMLYVLPQYSRQGVGGMLLADLLRICAEQRWQHLTTDASRLSLRLFTRFGFRVIEVQQVDRNGVWIERFRMDKRG